MSYNFNVIFTIFLSQCNAALRLCKAYETNYRAK